MKLLKKITSLATSASFLLFLPMLALAEQAKDCDGKICNPLGDKNSDLFTFINTVIDAAIKIGAVVAVLAIIYAGFLFVTAQGDEGKIKTAKAVLLYSALGILILFGARALSDVIVNTVKNVDEATR